MGGRLCFGGLGFAFFDFDLSCFISVTRDRKWSSRGWVQVETPTDNQSNHSL